MRPLALGACLIALLLSISAICGGADRKTGSTTEGSPYLFVWAGDAAHKSSDFLAVMDANPSSPAYGSVVRTLPVGVGGTMPHHTEYEFPAGNMLLANGWVSGKTFIFDLNQPLQPRIVGQVHDVPGYAFPHSFVRIADGHVLATFQSPGPGYGPGGGLVELDQNGSAVRSASAVDPAVNKDLIWPYSLVVVPQIDRVISSSTVMGWPEWAPLPPGSWGLKEVNDHDTSQVQVWRLSDLRLLKTVNLPADSGRHNQDPAEPRLLPDGSVYVNTFRCGLYRVTGLHNGQPSATRVYTFPGGDDMHTMCAVPVVVGHYWIQTVGALPGLIVLDVSHPEKPVEVSRLALSPRFAMPHWLAADRAGNRLVITGDEQSWVLVARFDAQSGRLSVDQTFREHGAEAPGFSFDREQWPHGKTGRAVVHGALFGPH